MAQTRVYWENLTAFSDGARIIANKGGTRSGKTYSIMSLIAYFALSAKTILDIDVVSESIPHLRRGALKDFEEILDSMGAVENVQYVYNRSYLMFDFTGGAAVRFFAAEDWGKVKGGRRDILFVNECNRIPYETFRQLNVRTTRCIFIDWNPDAEFWYETKGLCAQRNTVEIHSTYLDNPYLSKEQIAAIEANKDDEEWWRIYGLGQTGRAQGIIFTNWEQCEAIPDGAKIVGRGLDFGFKTDPTALVAVYKQNGELWIKEELYNQGMTNDKIADALKGKAGDIIADSSEQKSIEEIHNYGIRGIEPSKKGNDSIKAGIGILHRYKMHVTADSVNLIKELRNYKWKEDKITGELLGEPIDKFNHAIDALRYVALNKLMKRKNYGGITTRLSSI